MFRVALLGIYHESNTFIEGYTTISDFTNSHWLTGEAICKEYSAAHHEIGGMMEVLEENNIEVVPVMFAEAVPGAPLSAKAYHVLLEKMINELNKRLPVDGCMVALHGAGVAEQEPDMDGHWLSLLRKKLGPEIPVIGTLDPHANCSDKMIAATDVLVAYHTNPHIDQRQTGREVALLMVKKLLKQAVPIQVKTDLPIAISIEQQFTSEEPCLGLYRYAERLSIQPGILSISILLGFPYADVEEMGSSIIVVTDNNRSLAESTGMLIKDFVLGIHTKFNGEKIKIDTLLTQAQVLSRPVLLLDMGDNVGGGAPGNSSFLLDTLEAAQAGRFVICIYDPASVKLLAGMCIGDTLCIRMGDSAVERTVLIRKLCDGKFWEREPRHGGQMSFDMGPIAIVQTENGNTVLLTSLRVPPFSLQQLVAFNIIPSDYDLIVAKGVNAPIAAYAGVCNTIIKLDTPGVTQADMTRFTYRNRRIPLFPFEKIM